MSLKSVSKTCKLAVFLYIFYKYMVYQSNQKIYASSLPPLSDLFRESDQEFGGVKIKSRHFSQEVDDKIINSDTNTNKLLGTHCLAGFDFNAGWETLVRILILPFIYNYCEAEDPSCVSTKRLIFSIDTFKKSSLQILARSMRRRSRYVLLKRIYTPLGMK